MFQFLEVAISRHPRFTRTPLAPMPDLTADTITDEQFEVTGLGKRTVSYSTNTGELMDELWQYCVEEGNVLLMPAKLFQVAKPGVDQTDRLNFFRATVGKLH
jgi:hypothetical protein